MPYAGEKIEIQPHKNWAYSDDNLLEVLNYQEDNYLTIGNDVRNTLISKVTGNLTSM